MWMSADMDVTPGFRKSNGVILYPSFSTHGSMKPPKHASTWKGRPFSKARVDNSGIGSIICRHPRGRSNAPVACVEWMGRTVDERGGVAPSMGAPTPWQYCGADAAMRTVLRVMARRIASTSTWKVAFRGTWTIVMPK